MSFPTVQGLEFSIGFMLTTGLHSVIPYHSKITPFGTNFLNFSKTFFGHFSAHTTAYFILSKSHFLAIAKIIFKNVGVLVIAVGFVCFIISKIVFASFGSGV
jgi:hypothetical protein